jgi:hypothetical protein
MHTLFVVLGLWLALSFSLTALWVAAVESSIWRGRRRRGRERATQDVEHTVPDAKEESRHNAPRLSGRTPVIRQRPARTFLRRAQGRG